MSANPAFSSEPNAYRNGVLVGMAAYIIWGFYPIYFKIMHEVLPAEMVAHRIVWSVPFGALIIALRQQWSDVREIFTNRKTLLMLTLSAILIAFNWGVYIWAVQIGQIMQASLGYYINPLIYVLVGVVFLSEKLRRLQIAAVALAAIGVGILTVLGGQFPWISLILAGSFTGYGVIRKQVAVGAMPGLFVETLVLLPVAAIYLIWLSGHGGLSLSASQPGLAALLIFAGPLTVTPLVFFALAARRLTLTLLGFLQFIGPTLQFGCALYFGETLSPARAICFGFIWSAVALFCFSAWRASQKTAIQDRA